MNAEICTEFFARIAIGSGGEWTDGVYGGTGRVERDDGGWVEWWACCVGRGDGVGGGVGRHGGSAGGVVDGGRVDGEEWRGERGWVCVRGGEAVGGGGCGCGGLGRIVVV